MSNVNTNNASVNPQVNTQQVFAAQPMQQQVQQPIIPNMAGVAAMPNPAMGMMQGMAQMPAADMLPSVGSIGNITLGDIAKVGIGAALGALTMFFISE